MAQDDGLQDEELQKEEVLRMSFPGGEISERRNQKNLHCKGGLLHRRQGELRQDAGQMRRGQLLSRRSSPDAGDSYSLGAVAALGTVTVQKQFRRTTP